MTAVMAPATATATPHSAPLAVLITPTAVIIDFSDALLADQMTQLHDWDVPYELHHMTEAEVASTIASARFFGRHAVTDRTDWGLR